MNLFNLMVGLSVALTVLKLTGYIVISWLMVALPVIIWLVYATLLMIVLVYVAYKAGEGGGCDWL